MLGSFVISVVILGVQNDAAFKNDICRRVSQRLGPVLVNFNVNTVVFRKIFNLPTWVMLGIILGVKKYADYENTIAELISRRVGVVPITSMLLWVAYDENLAFFSYVELGIVSNVFEGWVGLGWVWLG